MRVRQNFALLCLLASWLALASPALADGFAVYEWSARGVGMANAMMFSDEVSVLAFNPAAITQFDEKGQLAFGVSQIGPKGDAAFYNSGGYLGTQSNEDNPAYVPYGFYARKIDDNGWFGVGLYPRFGLYATYSSDWMGRFNNYNAELVTVSVAPTFAWKMGPSLSMAVGAEIMYAHLKIGRALSMYGNEIDMGLKGDSYGFGWSAGLNWQVTPKWSLAFVYRSEVSQDMGADVAFSGTITGSAKAQGKVTLPDSYTFGVGYRFDDRTRMEFNAIRTNWSSYDRLYIALWDISFMNGTYALDSEKNWDDGWRYQVGIEHKLNDRWTIRAGYCYDASVVPDSTVDFMVPTGTRQTYSVGASYRVNNVEYSLGYGYMDIGDRTVLNAGETSGSYAKVQDCYAHIIALGCRIDL